MGTVVLGALGLSLLGSFHCFGMCGGFALLSKGRSTSFLAPGLLAYFAGKTISYVVLGYLFGLFGQSLHHSPMGSKVLAIGIGLVMIWIGLELAGIDTHRNRIEQSAIFQKINPFRSISWFHSVASKHGVTNRGILGVLNGLLPCGLLYAAFAAAAQTGHGLHGALFMLVFGLGTLPSLLLAANVLSLLSSSLRAKLVHLAGWILVAYGAITILRGTGVLAQFMH